MTQYRPTFAEIDLAAIRDNVAALSALVAPDVEKLAVVKANAYGHGDVETSRACIDAGATHLGVALVEEGIRLRDAGIDSPVVLLVEATPEAAKAIVDHRLTPSVFTRASAEALSEAASVQNQILPVHVCVDTGMHREGVPLRYGAELVELIAKLPSLEVEGLWSHFAAADEDANPFTDRQIEAFADLCEAVVRRGVDVRLRHLANTAGFMSRPDVGFDLVRMGIGVYGLYPADWLRSRCDLRPAMQLRSAVGSVRRVGSREGVSYGLTYSAPDPTTIATVLIGYGDGFARMLSNRGEVLIGGRRRPVAGRVTMDTTLVDCGDDEVEIGDEVTVIGRQRGDQITADEIADKIGTINYEVVTSVGPRVPRVYVS